MFGAPTRSFLAAMGFVAVAALFQNCSKPGSSALGASQSALLSTSSSTPGLQVPENYPQANLSWGESYYQSHLLMRFQMTGDVSDIQEFFARAAAVIAKRDDKMNRLSKQATWSSLSLYEADFGAQPVVCSNAGLDGMILNPFAEFLALTAERPDLFHTISADVLADEKSRLSQAIREVIDYHQLTSWNRTLGTYGPSVDCAAVDSRNRAMRDFERLPFNLIAAMGKVHFKLYLYSGDATELQRAISIARDLKIWFKSGPNGELYWPYLYADPDPEDRSHGAIVFDFIRLLAEHGVVFNRDTLAALEKTVRDHILGTTGVVMNYIGGRRDSFVDCGGLKDSKDFYACRDLALWLPAVSDAVWTKRMAGEVHPDSGAFGLLAASFVAFYPRNFSYGESCRFDGECATGSCFAHHVCGYKLGYGSACKYDSDCGSGQCFAGQTCGQPLGTGSTCTRHHECVSGLCTDVNGLRRCG